MRRKSDSVQSIDCDVELAGPMSSLQAAFVAQETLKHLLFMRNQIPSLFHELASKVLDDEEGDTSVPKRQRRPAGKRKLVKFVDQALQLTSLLSPSLFQLQEQTVLLFMLGPSPLRPLEVYCMQCSACMNAAADLSDHAQASAQHTARKVLRSLIINTAAHPEGRASAGATKLFVLLLAPEQATPPPGFLPKRTFQFRQRKGMQVHINLRQSTDVGSGSEAVAMPSLLGDKGDDMSERGSPNGLIWYQCTIALKGLTKPSPNTTGITDFM